MTHNHFIKVGLLVSIIFLVFATTGLAADHEQLTPLLTDLKGWSGEQARGMTMDMGASKMINATRQYQKGKTEITGMVMLGNQAMTQGSMQAMKAETNEGKMSISTIDGFKVQSHYNKNEKSGAVIVFLSQNQSKGAMFTLVYEGLSEEEGLSTAKKFNWKKMKVTVDKLF